MHTKRREEATGVHRYDVYVRDKTVLSLPTSGITHFPFYGGSVDHLQLQFQTSSQVIYTEKRKKEEKKKEKVDEEGIPL